MSLFAELLVSDEVKEITFGVDWLTENDCKWHFAEKQIEIGGRKVPLRSRRSFQGVKHVPGGWMATVEMYAEHGIVWCTSPFAKYHTCLIRALSLKVKGNILSRGVIVHCCAYRRLPLACDCCRATVTDCYSLCVIVCFSEDVGVTTSNVSFQKWTTEVLSAIF